MASTSKNQTTDEIREQLHRRMLSSVSHDLKTPLATIIGSLEIYERMADRLTPEKKTALLNAALNEAYRLDNFITNILDMAKLETGAVVPRPELSDLNYALNDCITRMGPQRELVEISVVNVNCADGFSFVDAGLLTRAVGLILDNAVKYGGKTPVIIEYGYDGDFSFVRIRDHGAGIPAGKEEIIFSKYTRFNHTDYQNAGTGLGLSICRELMRLLGGQVRAENHPQGGAQFILTYPKVQDASRAS